LTRPFDKHLDNDELDGLVSLQAQGVPDFGRLPDSRLGEAQRHVESCEDCNRKVQMHRQVQGEISRLGSPGVTKPGAQCPQDVEWLHVAAGLLPQSHTKELMLHAAQCEHCGPLLRNGVEALSDEATPNEDSLLAGLSSARPEWQKDLAGKLRSRLKGEQLDRSHRSWWRPFPLWPRPLFVAGALAVLMLAGWLGLTRLRTQSAEQLLAQAYTEHRTLEMRIPGAQYAPMRVERSTGRSSVDKSPALLKAEALIGDMLRKNPNDPAWLQAKARADLLDGNYESAIQTLRQALEFEPDSAPLLTDLGAAYFQRGEATDRAADYGSAVNSLGTALAKSPDDPVALFNRAIVSERTFLYTQAVDDWKHYLRVETNSDWASEARTRLAALEQKLRQHSQRVGNPLMTPEEFAEGMGSGREEFAHEVDTVIERYQNVALESWLPLDAVKGARDGGSREFESQALSFLADELRDRHGDMWLSDFLSAFRADTRGLTLLLAAVRANSEGDHENGLRLSHEAAAQFQSEGNEAGQLRAEFESLYSEHLSAQGHRCHQQAKELLPRVRERRYAWLEIQTLLETAACAAEISRIDESIITAEEALQIARSDRYGSLELRATVFVAGLLEDSEQALRYLKNGLSLYWAGNYEPTRGYSLLAVMDTTAEQLRLWFFDEVVIQEALRIVGDDPDSALRATEQYRLARAQLITGNTKDAERNFREAKELLKRSPSRDLIVDISIYLAETYIQGGRYLEALNLLKLAEPQMSKMSHDILRGRFYAARAAALLGSGRGGEAAEAIVPAVQIADRGLASISLERERVDWIDTFGPTYRALVQLRFRDNPESSFRWWEAFKGASVRRVISAETHRPADYLSDPELPVFPSWQSSRTTLISYSVFPDGIALWSFDGQNVHAVLLQVPTADFDSLVRRFIESCEDPSSDVTRLVQQGHELYELLVRPAEKWVHGSSHLIFETDGQLERIPFEALVTDQGKFLSESYVVSYSPGLLYLATAHQVSHIDSLSRALVVGEPLSGNSGIAALPDALDESQEVAALFPAGHLLSRREATLSAVLRELPQSEIFHFAGHTTTNGNVVGLVLSGSEEHVGMEVLTASHLDRKALAQTDLVVLSACSTLHGRVADLSDRDSLARTLLAAGVPQVVASRWPVDSAATVEWMRVFYRDLLEGRSAAQAARTSMIRIRRETRWNHPFYWAAFSSFGA
jgi:CHAT domain-containing protein/tetratricopeptide (TPR) repeat protein